MTRRIVYRSSLNGTGQILREFPVNASQTIERGDIVVLATNKASIAADAAAAGTVLGVSDTDIETTASPAATDVIKVDVNPASIYRMKYTGAGTVAIGNKYDLSTAAYAFDSADTTDGWIQVVGNIDTDAMEADVILCNRVFGMA